MPSRQSVRPWLVCLGGGVMLFSVMGLGSNIYSVYQPYIIAENGFSNAQAGWIVTIRSLFIVVSMFTANRLCARLGLRRTAAGAMLLLALSRFLFGTAGSLPAYLTAGALTGLAYGWAGMIPLSLLVSRWFQDRSAFALGLASAGSGLATILVPGPLTWLLQTRGLAAAFYAEGTLVLILHWPSFFWFGTTPPSWARGPISRAGGQRSASPSAPPPAG